MREKLSNMRIRQSKLKGIWLCSEDSLCAIANRTI